MATIIAVVLGAIAAVFGTLFVAGRVKGRRQEHQAGVDAAVRRAELEGQVADARVARRFEEARRRVAASEAAAADAARSDPGGLRDYLLRRNREAGGHGGGGPAPAGGEGPRGP